MTEKAGMRGRRACRRQGRAEDAACTIWERVDQRELVVPFGRFVLKMIYDHVW